MRCAGALGQLGSDLRLLLRRRWPWFVIGRVKPMGQGETGNAEHQQGA